MARMGGKEKKNHIQWRGCHSHNIWALFWYLMQMTDLPPLLGMIPLPPLPQWQLWQASETEKMSYRFFHVNCTGYLQTSIRCRATSNMNSRAFDLSFFHPGLHQHWWKISSSLDTKCSIMFIILVCFVCELIGCLWWTSCIPQRYLSLFTVNADEQ